MDFGGSSNAVSNAIGQAGIAFNGVSNAGKEVNSAVESFARTGNQNNKSKRRIIQWTRH